MNAVYPQPINSGLQHGYGLRPSASDIDPANPRGHTETRSEGKPQPLPPLVAEFTSHQVILLDLQNVVKILSLYQRTQDAAVANPGDSLLQDRLQVVARWLDTILEKYDELSSEARVVVDLFVANWQPPAEGARATLIRS